MLAVLRIRLLIVGVILHFFFFFNDPATTEIYTLPLHDALPICLRDAPGCLSCRRPPLPRFRRGAGGRSEEHTSELQSRQYLVCRLLLEKKQARATTGTSLSLHAADKRVRSGAPSRRQRPLLKAL